MRRLSFQLNRRLSALTRRRVGLSLQDGELWAGEMLRPAGFSAGRGVCARGGCSARRCFALARRNDIPLYRIVNCAAARRLCLPDIVPARGYRARGAVRRGDVVLSVCFAFGSCRACVPIEMSCVRFTPGVRSRSARGGTPLARSRKSAGGRVPAFPMGSAARRRTKAFPAAASCVPFETCTGEWWEMCA